MLETIEMNISTNQDNMRTLHELLMDTMGVLGLTPPPQTTQEGVDAPGNRLGMIAERVNATSMMQSECIVLIRVIRDHLCINPNTPKEPGMPRSSITL